MRTIDLTYVLAGSQLKQTPIIRIAAGEDIRFTLTPSTPGSIAGRQLRLIISDTVNDPPLFAAADADLTRIDAAAGTLRTDMLAAASFAWATGIYVGEFREVTAGANTLLKRYEFSVTANPLASGDPATVSVPAGWGEIVGTLSDQGDLQAALDAKLGTTAAAAAYQPLDADLTAIAALTTTSFGRGSLVVADAAAFRTYIGAGTSTFGGAYGSLSGVPSTIVKTDQANTWSTGLQDFRSVFALFDATTVLPKFYYGASDYFTITMSSNVGGTAVVFPFAGTVVMTDGVTQSVYNKNFQTTNTKFFHDNSATKFFRFSASGLSVGTRIYTVPDYDMTIASLAGTEALSNKTYNGVTLTGSSSPTLAVTGATTVSGANTGDQDLSGYLTISSAASSYQPLNAALTALAAGTALTVAQGGSGRASTTAYGPIFGGTTSTSAEQSAAAGTSGQVLKSGGASAVGAYADDVGSIGFTIDGGGSAITTGIKGDISVPYSGTITSVTVLADQSGSIVLDIWKDTYANYPPTVADTITASAKPTLSTATKTTDSTLTGWTTAITAGDTLRFNVDSITTITRVTIILKVKKS